MESIFFKAGDTLLLSYLRLKLRFVLGALPLILALYALIDQGLYMAQFFKAS